MAACVEKAYCMSMFFYLVEMLYFYCLVVWHSNSTCTDFNFCCFNFILFIQISRPSQNITSPQTKLDVAPESNAPSNNSSGSVASTQKNNECSEKTSETQVSFASECHQNFTKIMQYDDF